MISSYSNNRNNTSNNSNNNNNNNRNRSRNNDSNKMKWKTFIRSSLPSYSCFTASSSTESTDEDDVDAIMMDNDEYHHSGEIAGRPSSARMGPSRLLLQSNQQHHHIDNNNNHRTSTTSNPNHFDSLQQNSNSSSRHHHYHDHPPVQSEDYTDHPKKNLSTFASCPFLSQQSKNAIINKNSFINETTTSPSHSSSSPSLIETPVAFSSLAHLKDDPLLPVYSRIGGEAGTALLSAKLMESILKDERINKFFAGKRINHIQKQKRRYFCVIFGGPNEYDGKGLGRAHQKIIDEGFCEEHYDAFIENLYVVLTNLKASRTLKKQIIIDLAKLRNQVLNKYGMLEIENSVQGCYTIIESGAPMQIEREITDDDLLLTNTSYSSINQYSTNDFDFGNTSKVKLSFQSPVKIACSNIIKMIKNNNSNSILREDSEALKFFQELRNEYEGARGI